MSNMDTQNFEKGRIKALQDERVYIQKKTFTKWANAFLEKVRVHQCNDKIIEFATLCHLDDTMVRQGDALPYQGIRCRTVIFCKT